MYACCFVNINTATYFNLFLCQHQGGSQFWIDQKKRQISAASYLYKVYDLKETSDKTSSIKASVNCCPMENISEPLEWGHEKEISTAKLYFKIILVLCSFYSLKVALHT